MMRLNVGILGHSPGWQQLLSQEGVAFSQVGEEISVNEHSVVVTGESIDDRQAERLRSYLKRGGAVLCSAQIYAQLANTNYAQLFVRYMTAEPDSAFEDVGLIDIQQKCRVALNANICRSERGATMVYEGAFLDGHIIVLPFNIDDTFLDHRSMMKSFYSTARRMPYERVSTVARGGIRRLISRSLELLHHRRGLPYAHLWYYPGSHESVFLFRVDTDRATQAELDQLYDLARRHRVPMTWFIDVKSQQDILGTFKRMQNQEFGIHCYDHRVYKDYERNRDNIQKAIDVMRLSGLETSGFAAPLGKWNKALARAVKEMGFQHSSEFSYDYDNLPSRPLFDDGVKGVWQIPVHPICVGSLKRQGYNDVRMIQYFEFVIRHKLAAREPMVLYHHPKDGNHKVLEHIFNYVESHRVLSMRFQDFLEWWKRRSALQLRYDVDNNHLRVGKFPNGDDIMLRVSKGDGTEVFVPPTSDVRLDGLAWETKPKIPSPPGDFLKCRRFNYRIPLTRTVDFLSR